MEKYCSNGESFFVQRADSFKGRNVSGRGGFSGGSGTSENPYIITAAEQLNSVRDHLDAYFILANDIDMTGLIIPFEGWRPIGNNDSPFTGHFDGNGHIIFGLSIDRGNSNAIGFFGVTENAFIENLGLEQVRITGGNHVGSLVGDKFGGTVSNCFATGRVLGGDTVGGLVGEHDVGVISNCYAIVSVQGKETVGGFIGYNAKNSTALNCYAAGRVIGEARVGGFAGENNGVFLASFFDIDATGQLKGVGAGNERGADGRTAEQMRMRETFRPNGWKFIFVWDIDPAENNGYPKRI